MGQAKLRGTYAERKAQAIAAGRFKERRAPALAEGQVARGLTADLLNLWSGRGRRAGRRR